MNQSGNTSDGDLGLALRFATIASVDLGKGLCVVSIDDGEDSQPLRWFESKAGLTRSWSPPAEGEQVLLICPAGELSAGMVLRGVNSDQHPRIGDSIEERLWFSDGAKISYNPETHKLVASLPAGSEIQVTADTIKITGDVEVTGKIDATGDIITPADVQAGTISLKTHVTTGVQAGAALSGPPQ